MTSSVYFGTGSGFNGKLHFFTNITAKITFLNEKFLL